MKVLLHENPYKSIMAYIKNNPGEGIGSELQRTEQNCDEMLGNLILKINGYENNNEKQLDKKTDFRRLDTAARLLFDREDIQAFVPPIYEPYHDERFGEIIYWMVFQLSRDIDSLLPQEQINFYINPLKKNLLVIDAIGKVIDQEHSIISSEYWHNLDSDIRSEVVHELHRILDAYYPFSIIWSGGEEDNVLLLSSNIYANKAFVNNIEKLNTNIILPALAMSGIETVLPVFYTDDYEVLETIKEKYNSEKEAYITGFRSYVRNCYELINAGDYRDAWHYADICSNNDLAQSLHDFETAVKQSDDKILKRIGETASGKMVSICRQFITGNAVGAGWEILEVLFAGLGKEPERVGVREELSHVSYAYEVIRNLSK